MIIVGAMESHSNFTFINQLIAPVIDRLTEKRMFSFKAQSLAPLGQKATVQRLLLILRD